MEENVNLILISLMFEMLEAEVWKSSVRKKWPSTKPQEMYKTKILAFYQFWAELQVEGGKVFMTVLQTR